MESMRSLLSFLPRHLHAIIPRGYQRIGDIILLRLDRRLLKHRKAIGQALLEAMDVQSVCLIRDVCGEYRHPRVEVLAGEGTETVHRESGCLFRLDVSEIMFSKGNLAERARLVDSVSRETVADMFAGIGYFTIPIAKANPQAHVMAIEKNPKALAYLEDNIELNSLSNVEVWPGDCRAVSRQLHDMADRVLMGYLPKTSRFLPAAFRLLKSSGAIHFHNNYRESELWDAPEKELARAAERAGYNARIISRRKVKSFAPRIWHVVLDVQCRAGRL